MLGYVLTYLLYHSLDTEHQEIVNAFWTYGGYQQP